METQFWGKSAKIGVPNRNSVRWHSTKDGRIATAMRALTLPTTPDKNFVNFVFGPWSKRAIYADSSC